VTRAPPARPVATLGLSALALSGCALLSRGQALHVRYYDPEALSPRAAAAGPPSGECELSLGRVSAGDDLRDEIALRSAPHEVAYYEDRRWTETPDNYLRRAIERALFEQSRCRRTLSATGPTLDLSLVGFEELRSPEAARVAVHLMLHDDTTVLCESSVEVTRPAGAGGFDAFVGAMGAALDDVVSQVTGRVIEAMRARSAAR